ncbi:putative MBL fold metallo-hydrolase [Monocercomonoides exilis]|uniref:putative MBL fold metallo-hydrolase n=1 Tax=Monocercomonoides exilis TaxID=2049356 RepID=UPI00355A01DB|nr:putative MBL fold metallo-hydrolase [Monocercomonoides exilis]
MSRFHFPFELEIFVVTELESNSILLYDKDEKEGIIVDCGGSQDKVVQRVKELSLKINHVYYTHGHFDHVDFTGQLAEYLKCPITVHSRDQSVYHKQLAFKKRICKVCNDTSVPDILDHHEGEEFHFGRFKGTIIHTPGHSPGSCSFYIPDILIMTGDTIFAQGVGHTRGPGASRIMLKESIKNKLLILNDGLIVLPGHGPFTTIGAERKYLTQYVSDLPQKGSECTSSSSAPSASTEQCPCDDPTSSSQASENKKS